MPLRRRGSARRSVATGLQAGLLAAWCLAPAAWGLIEAFRDPGNQFELTALPTSPTLANFQNALSSGALLTRGLVNSMLVASVVTVVALLLAGAASFVLARRRRRRVHALLGVLIGSSLVPPAILIGPLFVLSAGVGTAYSLGFLALVQLGLALPLAVVTAASLLRELPWELLDAALVDGCTRLHAFVRVMLPLAVPALATAAALTFIACWNEYLVATVLTDSGSLTAPRVIGDFSMQINGYSTTMAAGVLACIPPMLLVLILQRFLVRGLATGSGL